MRRLSAPGCVRRCRGQLADPLLEAVERLRRQGAPRLLPAGEVEAQELTRDWSVGKLKRLSESDGYLFREGFDPRG